MKKVIIPFLFLVGFLFCYPVYAAESIDDFSAVIKINQDASLNVTETITYDFGEVMKHGIYRDITYKYQARGGNYNLRLSILSVKDADGNNYAYRVSNRGADKRIEIGDADIAVTGKKVYVINYLVKRAINFFSDHDELYWNVTGNNWEVLIKQSKAEIIFPKNVGLRELKSNCYVGAVGSTNNCISDRFVSAGLDLASSVVFAHDGLAPKEGLTTVVSLPKGIINKPTWLAQAWDAFLDNGILFLPLLAFAIMFWLWENYGRDPRGQGTIIAEFDAPDNLTPAEVGTIIDERANTKDISAEIIYLAIRGYLKITRLTEGKIIKTADYELKKLKAGNDLTNDFDSRLMKALFSDNKTSVKLSDLKNEFYKSLKDVQKSVYQSVTDKHYFSQNPSKVRAWYMIGGGVLLALGIFAGSIFGLFGFFALVLSGIIVMIFGYFMPVKTRAGVLARENILGLKTYLSVAEKDRLKFHNAPAKNPDHFEKLLPYAMVLGVEKEWAKQFEGIYNQQPSWYSDPSGGYFTALALTNGLGNFQSRANSALATPPSSAASGGSGFSGGFSGGGFGGGGGGSW
jgi:uncharacterized membrane protein